MITLLSRLAHGRAALPAGTRAVAVLPDCFVMNGAVVRWDAVTRVRACKLARFAWDEICLEVKAEGLDAPLSLRERDKGFDDFVAMADRRMNFPLAWWSALPVRDRERDRECDREHSTRRGAAVLFERLAQG